MNLKRKTVAAISALALFALVGCFGKSGAKARKEAYKDVLREAVLDNDIEEAQRLIKAGADVNAKNASGWTLLMMTAERSALGMTRTLLEGGADVNAKDNDGQSVLMHAAHENATEVAKLLIAAGADIDEKDNRNRTALMHAGEWNADAVAQLLVESGAEVNAIEE